MKSTSLRKIAVTDLGPHSQISDWRTRRQLCDL